ncbi:hypothetical protein GDO81_018644 [Engystomops pustulosus]|uniref:Secreted protein n=1 Tax=Engystomops pustulosus TaxID=76066 RepID=A0AAV6ZBI7_ENGPU|nr:hypothetical protein GDO81_018644 [Engystomops pustulosus]
MVALSVSLIRPRVLLLRSVFGRIWAFNASHTPGGLERLCDILCDSQFLNLTMHIAADLYDCPNTVPLYKWNKLPCATFYV